MNGEGYHWENTEEVSQKRRNWSGVGIGVEAGYRRGGRLQSCGKRPDVVEKGKSKPASVPEVANEFFGDVEAPGECPWWFEEFWTNDPGGSC